MLGPSRGRAFLRRWSAIGPSIPIRKIGANTAHYGALRSDTGVILAPTTGNVCGFPMSGRLAMLAITIANRSTDAESMTIVVDAKNLERRRQNVVKSRDTVDRHFYFNC